MRKPGIPVFGDAMDMAGCNTIFKKEERHLVTGASGGQRDTYSDECIWRSQKSNSRIDDEEGSRHLVKNIIFGEECLTASSLFSRPDSL